MGVSRENCIIQGLWLGVSGCGFRSVGFKIQWLGVRVVGAT